MNNILQHICNIQHTRAQSARVCRNMLQYVAVCCSYMLHGTLFPPLLPLLILPLLLLLLLGWEFRPVIVVVLFEMGGCGCISLGSTGGESTLIG